MYNLLRDPLIRVSLSGGNRKVSLPELLTLMVKDEVESFPALRPHQRHAWHSFLSLLGAAACNSIGRGIPETPEAWRSALMGLTPQYPNGEPWSLVVPDLTKPAFMQPPASAQERLSDFKDTVLTPDELDILLTAKNHDIKYRIGYSALPDDWLFALVTLQTMEGFSGSRNYGISRMNSGYGNRPAVSIAPTAEDGSLRLGACMLHDMQVLLDNRGAIQEVGLVDGGITLMWLHTWDGKKTESIGFLELDPYYMEICRRIRFVNDGRLHALRATSESARVKVPSNFTGRVGDAWTPYNKKLSKSLTVSGSGFTHRLIVDMLGEDWEMPIMVSKASASSPASALVMRAMARGMGVTEKYHERILPLHGKTRSAFIGFDLSSKKELHEIAKIRVADIANVRSAFRHAVSTLIAGDSSRITSEHRQKVDVWSDRLTKLADRGFFADLQIEFRSETPEQIRVQWRKALMQETKKLFEQAIRALPSKSSRHYESQAEAERILKSRLSASKGGFPELKDFVIRL